MVGKAPKRTHSKPVYGYKITSAIERKEVEWLVMEGTFKSVEEFEAAETRIRARNPNFFRNWDKT